MVAFQAAKNGAITVRTAKSIQTGRRRPKQRVSRGRTKGVPDTKALMGLKEAKCKVDELYREVMGRKEVATTRETVGAWQTRPIYRTSDRTKVSVQKTIFASCEGMMRTVANRTKMFHVKLFGTIGPRNQTN